MIGTRLSHYNVIARLGAGGMGEVFRAEDTKLGRSVALKLLPDDFATDADRLARFEREAKLLASLNHPNIAAIHGLEEVEGRRFLVLELVEGQDLAERLARGPVPFEEALEIAVQVAAALEEAHDKGIVHRDLKPANVKLTPDGKVKVLDFGLAKAWSGELGVASGERGPDPSQSPTLARAGTQSGMILGTAAYMAPEQARGKAVDRRADVWAFGCLLWEMLTGKRLFAAETVSDAIAGILRGEIDWNELPASSGRVVPLLRRCLQKDVRRRQRDIADVRLEIEDLLAAQARPEAPTAGRAAGRRGVLLAVALAAAALGAFAGSLALRGLTQAKPGPPRVDQVARITHDPGISEWPTWSPDGKLLAYSSNRSGDFEIYVRRVEGGQDVRVTTDPGEDVQPALSPDGQWVAFVSTRSSRTSMIHIGATFGMEFRSYGGDLWIAPALGGAARRLATDANFPAWYPDGKRIVYVSGTEGRRSLLEVSAQGGQPRTLLSPEDSRREIVRVQVSPDGRWLSIGSVDPEQLALMAVGGGALETVVDASTHAWDPAGQRIYYLKRDEQGGTRLESIAVADGKPQGGPAHVGVVTGVLRDLSLARDGVHLAVSEMEGSMNLTRLPLAANGGAAAGPEQILSEGQVIDRYPDVSPDGRRVAFSSDRLGSQDIWIQDLDTRELRQLQIPGDDVGASLPVWTHGGARVALTRILPDGKRSLWLVAVDGSEARELRGPTAGLEIGSASPDGEKLLIARREQGVLQLYAFEIASGSETPLSSSALDKHPGEWSPDGRWVTFYATAEGALQLWRIPAGGGTEEQLTRGQERFRHAAYSPDGLWLYVQPSHRNVYRMRAAGGPVEAVTRFPESGLFLEEPALSPDGRYLYYCRSHGSASLWLMTLEEPKP